MGSWAAVAKADAHEPEGPAQRSESSNISVAVVDTNAIISGLQLDRIADAAVTIPEVFSEIRDKQARQTLATLPYSLEAQEPSEDSVKAVLRFARATGDLHSLSSADIKLIALAHTLELLRHGDSALHALPEATAVHKGTGPADRQLPGWNATGGTWTDMDKLAEEEILEAELKLAGILSKVSQAVQSLNIDAETQETAEQHSNEQPHPTKQQTAEAQRAEQQPDSKDVDDWQKASSSHNAARKKKRKQQRRAAWQAGSEADAASTHDTDSVHTPLAPVMPAGHASAVQSQTASVKQLMEAQSEARDTANNATSHPPQTNSSSSTTAAAANALQSPSQRPAAASQAEVSAELQQAELATQAQSTVTHSSSSDSAAASESASGESGEEEDQFSSQASSAEDESGSDNEELQEEEASQSRSSVASVTADFAMQNVILQMGLRLVTPNGMRIKRITKWVLRCSACFKITKEPGRLFCPHCGNATLDKVELTIGPDGTEQYGVRKRFNTRGTRFSLPKPKGGFQKNAPILREDVLMQKLNKRRNRKPKDEGVDAFAPEYGPDSWFQKNHGSAAQYKGAAAALASWRHNPNERKHSRSNRRKK